MDRSAINAALLKNHGDFIARILAVPLDQLAVPRNGKWTPAQQLEHILRAVRPVSMALLVPKWFLLWRFGKPNRAARDYEALVARYSEKLVAGGRALGRFLPPAVSGSEVERMAADLRNVVSKFIQRVNGWSERDLDRVLLPHPLLGKLTVREMLFFTMYHVRHHQALVERDTA